MTAAVRVAAPPRPLTPPCPHLLAERTGVLGELPFGVVSLVGCKSVEGARQARLAGADALLVKLDLVQACPPGQEAALVQELRRATSGDD